MLFIVISCHTYHVVYIQIRKHNITFHAFIITYHDERFIQKLSQRSHKHSKHNTLHHIISHIELLEKNIRSHYIFLRIKSYSLNTQVMTRAKPRARANIQHTIFA